MLSPGKWAHLVPRERTANLLFRQNLLRLCKDKAYQKAAIEACKQDILFYINAFGWQYNPKKKGLGAVGPFLTWDYQEDALKKILDCYQRNRSAVVEKSREMGATWLFLFVEDWLCLFHPYVQTLNISHSAEAVDSKSPNSLFWKTRFMHRHLPNWLKGEIEESKMAFIYTRTNSTQTGEASTGRAGVGGRAALIFVDEMTKIREAKEIRQRTANTADCRFFNSTHEGSETEFNDLVKTPEFVHIQMHWTQHPEKRRGLYRWNPVNNQIEILDKTYPFPPDYNFVMRPEPKGGPHPGVRSPWYDWMAKEIGDTRAVAIELDIDVQGSVSQCFDPIIIAELAGNYVEPPKWEGDLIYDRDTAQPVSLEEKEGGPLKLWIVPKGLSQDFMPYAKYVAGADVSTGSGATNSVLSLGNAYDGSKVLEYAVATLRPEQFAQAVVAICRMFLDQYGTGPLLAWETPGPGANFGDVVLALGYTNIHYREAHATLAGGKVSEVPGWHSSPENKDFLLRDYRAALYARRFINPSELALKECLYYHYNSQSKMEHTGQSHSKDPSGARINHGDRVIADALCWKMMRDFCKPKKQEEPPDVPLYSLAHRRQLRQNSLRESDAWS